MSLFTAGFSDGSGFWDGSGVSDEAFAAEEGSDAGAGLAAGGGPDGSLADVCWKSRNHHAGCCTPLSISENLVPLKRAWFLAERWYE